MQSAVSLTNWLRFVACTAVLLIPVLAVGTGAGCGGPAPLSPTPRPSPAPPPPTRATPPPAPSPAPPPPAPSPARYALNLAVNPPGAGSVTPSGGTYDADARITLAATPADACWRFEGWSGDLSSNITPVPIILYNNRNITANFSRVRYTLSVTVTPPGTGSVGPVAGTYDCGQVVTIAATPIAGFTFDRWSADASGIASSTNVTMRANRNVVANFKTLQQIIKRDLLAGSATLSTVTLTNQIKAGERIEGFVELGGERQAGDASFSWTFSITGPLGTVVDNWQGNVLSTPRKDFERTAPSDGQYMLKVSHVSRWPKTLTIQIRPGGWQ